MTTVHPRAAGIPRNPIIPLPDVPIQAPPAEEEPEWTEDPEIPGVEEPEGAPAPGETEEIPAPL
jgi:hypothetical protein